MKQQKGNEGFGFCFRGLQDGTVQVVQTLNFISKVAGLSGEGRQLRVGMPGGPQFRARGVSYSVAVGRCIRFLDTTNGSERQTQKGLWVIHRELPR